MILEEKEYNKDTLYLGLRSGASEGANFIEQAGASIIQARLVTKFPHAGVVYQGRLWHATAKGGLIDEEFNNASNWTLLDLEFSQEEKDTFVLDYHKRKEQAGGKVHYDWFSLLAFTPLNLLAKPFGADIRYSKWIYCYEFLYEVLTKQKPKGRVTAEDLLVLYIKRLKKKQAV